MTGVPGSPFTPSFLLRAAGLCCGSALHCLSGGGLSSNTRAPALWGVSLHTCHPAAAPRAPALCSPDAREARHRPGPWSGLLGAPAPPELRGLVSPLASRLLVAVPLRVFSPFALSRFIPDSRPLGRHSFPSRQRLLCVLCPAHWSSRSFMAPLFPPRCDAAASSLCPSPGTAHAEPAGGEAVGRAGSPRSVLLTHCPSLGDRPGPMSAKLRPHCWPGSSLLRLHPRC